jgi:hypothetical protein
MRRAWVGTLAVGAIVACAVTVASQPPEEKGKGPAKHYGSPAGPPPLELGRVLPPHLRDQLDLTDEQDRQLDELEKEVKERLLKILTPEQRRSLRELRRHSPPGPPPKDRPKPPDRPDRY